LLALDAIGELREWDVVTGRALSRGPALRIDVNAAAFAPDGSELATCHGGRTEIRRLDGEVRLRSDDGCDAIAFHEGGVVWAVRGDTLVRLDVRGDVPIERTRIEGPHGRVLATADGGRRVATAAGVWDQHGEPIWSVPRERGLGEPPPRLELARALALDRDRLIAADATGVRAFGLSGAPTVQLAGREPEITALAPMPDGELVALGDENGRVSLVDRRGEPTTLARASHRGAVRGLWWRGGTIVSAGEDTTIVLWSPLE
jgi:hypothetical protein